MPSLWVHSSHHKVKKVQVADQPRMTLNSFSFCPTSRVLGVQSVLPPMLRRFKTTKSEHKQGSGAVEAKGIGWKGKHSCCKHDGVFLLPKHIHLMLLSKCVTASYVSSTDVTRKSLLQLFPTLYLFFFLNKDKVLLHSSSLSGIPCKAPLWLQTWGALLLLPLLLLTFHACYTWKKY